MILTTYITT